MAKDKHRNKIMIRSDFVRVLQSLSYAPRDQYSSLEMYLRPSGQVAILHDQERIVFGFGSVVGLDTFFNVFSVGQWKRYTGVKDLALVVKGRGRFLLTIEHRCTR